MKIEVGKSYIDRTGYTTRIVGTTAQRLYKFYPFVCTAGCHYAEDGSAWGTTNGDLMFEVLDDMLQKLQDILPNDLFESDEYQEVDIVGKVEYILTLYKSQKEFIEQLG